MIAWLASTIGVGAVSAVFPLVNMEVYVVGLAVGRPGFHWSLIGTAAAVGQMIGKLLFYYAGHGGVRLARLRRSTDSQRAGRWAARLDRFRDTCRERPRWAAGILLLSAFTGLPPFAVMALIAGTAGIPVTTFIATGLIGRTARFALLAASPGLLAYFT